MRVSVALATYNGARFIRQQIESILGGSRVPDQVVVSDDVSTDDTLDIVRSIFAGRSFPQLVVIEGTETLGVTANFARALEACDGDLVVLADQDDIWHSDRLAAALPAFISDRSLLLQHSDARLVHGDGTALGGTLFEAIGVRDGERRAIDEGRPFEAYVRRNLATGATVVLRRELVDTAWPFPESWVHDEWLAIIAAATGSVSILDRALIDYRQHGGNQIGASAPTLTYRLSRFTEPRRDRYARLADRSRLLVERLERLDVASEILALARDKARFEEARSQYPRSRITRIPKIAAQVRLGSYRRLSSQQSIDIARDLLQPA